MQRPSASPTFHKGSFTPAFHGRRNLQRLVNPVALLMGLLSVHGCGESALKTDPAPRPEVNVVVADGRDWREDPYVVNSAAIDGHWLTIEVSYTGGCRRHDFTLVISKSFRESDPVQLPAVLAHDDHDDPCEAYPTESHVFDLTLVRTRYQQFYGPGPGKVILRIPGVSGDDLVYEFDELPPGGPPNSKPGTACAYSRRPSKLAWLSAPTSRRG